MTEEHLSDEQLSAHLDGESPRGPSDAPSAQGDPDAHLAACDACRGRLVALDATRELVRTPVVPVSAAVRTAAVRAALAPESPAAGRSPTRPVPAPWFRRPQVLVGTAAAVAVLAVGVSVAATHHGGTTPAQSAARAAPSSSPAASRASSSPDHNVPSAASAPAAPADIGTVTSTSALRSRLSGLMVSQGAPLGQANASAAGASATTSASSDKAANPTATSSEFGVTAVAGTCEAAAHRAAGENLSIELVAVATFKGTPALVVVVPSSTGASGHLAVVVARSTCGVLARTTF